MPHTLATPLPGRFRNHRNHALTLERAARPELEQLQPTTRTAQAAHLLVSHRFAHPRGDPYDALIDERAFTLLKRTGIKEGLIETNARGQPVAADRFLEALAPYERYFEPGPRNPLAIFKRDLEARNSRPQGRDPDHYLDDVSAGPHGGP